MAFKKDELTPKQRIFCEEYLIDWNGTRAAIAAGYSKKTAQAIAAENLTKPLICDYLEEIQKDLKKLAGVSALRNMQELKKMAYSNLHNYHTDWMTIEAWDNVSIDDKAAISEFHSTTTEFNGVKKTVVKFKLHDKKAALDSLNKMMGTLGVEKVDHTTNGESLNNRITGIEIIRTNETKGR